MASNEGVAYLGPGKVEVQSIDYPQFLNPHGKSIEHGVILKVVSANICSSAARLLTTPQTKGEEMTMPKARMRWILGLCLALAIIGMWISAQAQPRSPDVMYVPAPHNGVAEMLRLAGVTSNDVVYGLGSGDGRVVIAAATRYGARGVGVDIDPQRIQEGRANARQAGVADRVQFLQIILSFKNRQRANTAPEQHLDVTSA